MYEKLTIKNGWGDFIKKTPSIKNISPPARQVLKVAYYEGAVGMVSLLNSVMDGGVDPVVFIKSCLNEYAGVVEELNKINTEYPQNEKTD